MDDLGVPPWLRKPPYIDNSQFQEVVPCFLSTLSISIAVFFHYEESFESISDHFWPFFHGNKTHQPMVLVYKNLQPWLGDQGQMLGFTNIYIYIIIYISYGIYMNMVIFIYIYIYVWDIYGDVPASWRCKIYGCPGSTALWSDHSDHQDLGCAALQCLVVFGGSFDLRSGPTAFVPRWEKVEKVGKIRQNLGITVNFQAGLICFNRGLIF